MAYSSPSVIEATFWQTILLLLELSFAGVLHFNTLYEDQSQSGIYYDHLTLYTCSFN